MDQEKTVVIARIIVSEPGKFTISQKTFGLGRYKSAKCFDAMHKKQTKSLTKLVDVCDMTAITE